MKTISCFIFFSFFLSLSHAQPRYWQQKVDTKIEVTLDDEQHFLHGFETIIYTNNAPDTLTYLYIHLWPNAYKHDHTAFAEQQYRNGKTDFYYAKEKQCGYIDSLDFEADGNDLNFFSNESTPDIARIDLVKPLLPGNTITITTPFRVKLPKVFSRLGHTKQAYFISQWFPKPAVYDKKGWHPMPYLDLGEFYSEFGSYDVKITLPKNYVVMATGNLMTESEQQWLDSLAKVNIYDTSFADIKLSDSFPESSTTLKTIHFHQDNVHDFAWFADKRYMVRKDSFSYANEEQIRRHNKHKEDTGFSRSLIISKPEFISVYTAFLPTYKKSWRKGIQYLKDALKIYGEHVGHYPYKTIKAVQGDMKAGGGMEYPTVTVIDKALGGNKTVIVHEAGHNWFYGILGTNERDHAWMDEGINSFYEQKTMKATADTSRSNLKNRGDIVIDENDLNSVVLAQLARSGEDQPIHQTSNLFKELNYGMDVYYKTADYLAWMESYMGAENFEAGMKDYFNQWKFKHPYPEDFKAVMEKHSNRSLDWFFDDLLHNDRPVDFSIVHASKKNNAVTIKNKTDHALPVDIDVYNKDIWMGTVSADPFKNNITLALPSNTAWTHLRIDPKVADVKMQNNRFPRAGIQLKPFAGSNHNYKQKIFALPAIGYNYYDGIGLGLVFHNITWPENKFRFIAVPMYSFRSKSFNGLGSVAYVTHPKKTFQEITLQTDIKSFHYDESGLNIPELKFARYFKIAPSLNLQFKESNPLSTVKRNLLIKGYAIREDYFDFVQNPVDSLYRPSVNNQNLYYGLLSYTHENNRTFNPFSYKAAIHGNQDFAKLSLEGNIRIDYHLKNKSLYIRAFAGKFFSFRDNSFEISRYFLNSSYHGENDYLYDATYLGRSEREGFAAHQISYKEGGLKIPTPFLANRIGRTDNWLASLNLKTDLPIKLPLRLFLDVATFADAGEQNPSGSKILYDAGVEIFFKDIVNIYIPIIMSKDYKDYFDTIILEDKFLKSITFSIQLDKIKWLNASSDVFRLVGY